MRSGMINWCLFISWIPFLVRDEFAELGLKRRIFKTNHPFRVRGSEY